MSTDDMLCNILVMCLLRCGMKEIYSNIQHAFSMVTRLLAAGVSDVDLLNVIINDYLTLFSCSFKKLR